MKKILLSIAAPVLLATLIGCQVYEVDVIVDSDGGGHREVSLVVMDGSALEQGMSIRDFRKLFGVEKRDGWKFERIDDDGGWFEKKFGVFHRERDIKRTGRWKNQSGDVRLKGSKRRGPHGPVEFSNEIDFQRDGDTWIYRETFRWKGLRDVVVTMQLNNFVEELDEAYPFLSRRDLKRLRAMAEDELNSSLSLLVESGDDDPRVAERIRKFAEKTADFLRDRKSGARLAAVSPAVENLLTDKSGRLERELSGSYPGAALSFMTSLNLSVDMPGRVIDGNYERIEDGRAKWSFDLSDAILEPLVLEVESRR